MFLDPPNSHSVCVFRLKTAERPSQRPTGEVQLRKCTDSRLEASLALALASTQQPLNEARVEMTHAQIDALHTDTAYTQQQTDDRIL